MPKSPPTREQLLRRFEHVKALAWFGDVPLDLITDVAENIEEFILPLLPVSLPGGSLVAVLNAAGIGIAWYLIALGRQLGLPKATCAKLVKKVFLDFVIGFIPLAGPLVDVFVRTNREIVNEIQAHLNALPIESITAPAIGP